MHHKQILDNNETNDDNNDKQYHSWLPAFTHILHKKIKQYKTQNLFLFFKITTGHNNQHFYEITKLPWITSKVKSSIIYYVWSANLVHVCLIVIISTLNLTGWVDRNLLCYIHCQFSLFNTAVTFTTSDKVKPLNAVRIVKYYHPAKFDTDDMNLQCPRTS